MVNEMKRVPELRFSQFDKEWEKTTIADIGEFYYGRSAPKWSITDDATIPCVRYGELYTKHKGTVKEIYSYTNIDRNKLRFSKGGEILIPRVGEDPMDFAKCSYLPFSGVAIGEMISVYNTDQNPVFITAYFNSQMKYEFAKRVEGASVSNLYYSYLKDINLRIPTIEEQQKIGDFFSKLDRQIELEEQKLEKLEEQKKGYMQKIFSQELRFKDENGNDYPEWEDKLISDIGKVITGNTPSKKENDYWNSNQYIWVTPTDISNKKNIYTSGYQLSQKGFSKARQLPKNTLLITCIASIGKNAILRIEGSCNQQINAVIPNDNYDVDYLYYAFEDVSKLMKSIAGKTATQIVNKAVFEKLLLNVPIYEEQQKISGFLNKVDILIDKQAQKIDELKLRKQGFLQKMFV